MTSIDIKNRFNNLQSNMLNYAYMLTSNRTTARELIAQTKAIALEHSADLSNESMFKGWIFSMMRKVFASEFQARKANAVISKDVYAINLTSEADDLAATRPEGSHSSAAITHALQSLTDSYRRISELYFIGHSISEIAVEMNLSVQVVKSRLAYCRNRLRVEFEA